MGWDKTSHANRDIRLMTTRQANLYTDRIKFIKEK